MKLSKYGSGAIRQQIIHVVIRQIRFDRSICRIFRSIYVSHIIKMYITKLQNCLLNEQNLYESTCPMHVYPTIVPLPWIL